MNSLQYSWLCFCLALLITASPAGADGQTITGLGEEAKARLQALSAHQPERLGPSSTIYLRRAVGQLSVQQRASTETYEAYFHIPIAYQDQVPILIEVESDHLIDYRFVHFDPPNVMIAARMRSADYADLHWTAWVMVKENTWWDLPSDVPFPALEDLPEEVRPWLQETDCAQISAQAVQIAAAEVRSTAANLTELADNIALYCDNIPSGFAHNPAAFDAFYAINWGNSCTGHAHAGAALFRANGIPARTLLNLIVDYPVMYDHHWIIDYFVPQYGWVRMETVRGLNPAPPEMELVTYVLSPGNEFTLFYPCGIDSLWHTSDPVLGMHSPRWGQSHNAYHLCSFNADPAEIDAAYDLAVEVFGRYTESYGIRLTAAENSSRLNALAGQRMARDRIAESDLAGFVEHLEYALNEYDVIDPAPFSTLLFNDFEDTDGSWAHGGEMDEWEWGEPVAGPAEAFSGQRCWGTDLDGTYENHADNWLLSPPIDLSSLSCAFMRFAVWNWVHDWNQFAVYDPLWIDVTADGTEFIPLCNEMGGVNDDPAIPAVGGWNELVLDLTRYVGQTIRIRFRFQSDGTNIQPGSYIDDVHVYGRPLVVVPLVTGPGPGPVNPPLVRTPLGEWITYGVEKYGVNVACGTIDWDGLDEIVTGPGPGAMFGPHVRGWQPNGTALGNCSFIAYGTQKYGVNVACGDIDADGFDEILTGPGPGAVFGPHARGWNVDGGDVQAIPQVSFLAYGTNKFGVNIAAGDVDGDGFDEIITGAGPGAVFGPHVRGWNHDGGTGTTAIPGLSFLAYSTPRWGVNVACGDIDGDGLDEIVTGAGPGQVFGAHVRAWNYDGSGATQVPGASFFAYSSRYGVVVSTGDVDLDGMNEILTMPGPSASNMAHLRAWNADGGSVTLVSAIDYLAYESWMTHGGKIAGGKMN